MSFTYARLASPEDTYPSTQNYHRSYYRSLYRDLLLVILFLLSFIFVFIFTISLSLLFGDIHHERSQVLMLEATNELDELLPDDLAFYGESVLEQKELEPTIQSWSQIESSLPKVNRRRAREQNFDWNLLDLHNFSYHLTADRSLKKCLIVPKTTESLNLVILIHSAVDHFAHRQQLRRSWLHLNRSLLNPPNAHVVHAFILGQTESEEMQAAVQIEHRLYGDIVQAAFADSYHNLTYKHLAGLRWATQFDCSANADYLFKVDDDAFVDSYAVVEYLATRKAKGRFSELACSLFPEGTAPKRSGKWMLSYSVYPFESFPSYCSGVGYFVAPELVDDLLEAARRLPEELPVIQIDDVFVTGLLRSTLRPPVKPAAINGRYVYDIGKLRRWLKDGEECPSGYFVGDIGNEEDRVSLAGKLWSKTESAWRRRQRGLCSKERRYKSIKVSSL